MKLTDKKVILPLIIVIVTLSYYIALGVAFFYMAGVPSAAKIIALEVPGVMLGSALTILVQRIHYRRTDRKSEKANNNDTADTER